MLFSRQWLADYVELPAGGDELAERLTAAGFSVEYTTARGDDVLLDVDVTANRPDCMSHLGLAREIAVIFGHELREQQSSPSEAGDSIEEAARVEVEEPGLCPRYAARVIEGVQVGPSPAWLQDRLQAMGLRPVNNVVDVTNLVLWELGQPLHAFDLDRLAGETVIVRRAFDGETLVTLDGDTQKLEAGDLVIADADRAVAVAGVMGGLESEVGDGSTRVLLESAHFDRATVRRSARRLGLHTDASHRFERGADPGACARALDRAAQLILELAGGSLRRGVLDVVDEAILERAEICFEPARLDAFAGVHFDRTELRSWLEGLGIELGSSEGEVWRGKVPTWRRYDLERPADVYEEAMRILGFDAIPSTLPPVVGSDGPETPEQTRRRQLRSQLAAHGFAEAIHYAFLSPEEDGGFPVLGSDRPAIELQNPLSERYSVLRRGIVAGLVEGARFNQRRGVRSVRLFEIGHVFLDREVETVGMIMGGTAGTPWDRGREVDLFDLKGVIDAILELFAVHLEPRPAQLRGILEGTGAELHASGGGTPVGFFGRVDEEGAFPLFVAELVCEALPVGNGVRDVQVPSRFPGVEADLTLTHSAAVRWSQLVAAIRAVAPVDLADFGLKDRYRGEGVPPGAVNTTIGFHYNAEDRSLSQEEVNVMQARLAEHLEDRFGWEPRDARNE